MKKIIELEDHFSKTGELTVQLVLPLRGGRIDVGRVTKHASEALDYIKNVTPEPGKTHLLLLAMGGEETYGPNRNGDGFSENPVPAKRGGERWWVAPGQELTKHYQSFETNPAHAFKHHQNKDPAKASGHVKKAFWNPRMHRVELLTVVDNEKDAEWVERVEAGELPAVSMGCFLADARVTMSDGTQRYIQDVVVGDEVITHRGRVRRVIETHKRPYCGDIYTVRGEATAEIHATEEHPFWTTSWNSVKETDKTKGYPRWKTEARVDGEWTHARCLENQFLLSPIDRSESSPPYLTRAFARLLGYYIAEGHVIWRDGHAYGIELTTHKSDFVHQEIVQLCQEFGTRNAPWTFERKNCEAARGVMICDERLAELCRVHGGVSARHKRLSHEVMQWPPMMQRELFGAYANGDGHGRDGWLKVSTASDDLAAQWLRLLPRLGILASCNRLIHKAGNGFSSIDTYEWVIHIGIQWAGLLAKVCAKVAARDVRAKKESRKIIDGHTCTPIREVGVRYVEADVYNLEVEEDESYLIEGIAVHNCRIKYDVCSQCGNKAPTRADYCKHAQLMNMVNPDGTKNFVYNPDPDFFDISRVFRPADRIGYTMKKVADSIDVRLSADLGAEVELASMKIAAAKKLSEMDKVIHGEPIATSTMAPDEKSLVTKFRDHSSAKLASAPSIPVTALHGHSLRDVVSAADRAGLVLKDAEFIETAVSQLIGRPAHVDQHTVAKVAEAASAAIELFEESPTLLDWVIDECKLAESTPGSTSLDATMHAMSEKRAYAGELLYRRLVPEGAGIRPNEAPTTDLLHVGDRVTTRGAARDAMDEVTKAHMKKVLGGTALMLGGYKMLTAYPWMRRLRVPLALGAGVLGHKLLSPRPGGTIHTDEGFDIPDITEMAPKTAAIVHMIECARPRSTRHDLSRAKLGSRVDPVVGLVLDVGAVADCLGAIVAT